MLKRKPFIRLLLTIALILFVVQFVRSGDAARVFGNNSSNTQESQVSRTENVNLNQEPSEEFDEPWVDPELLSELEG